MAVGGMRSEVAVRVGLRDGISYLASSYFTPPFKVADVTEDRQVNELRLMLMCSSPGVLDGDRTFMRVELDAHTKLRLGTQSYQRLFRMEEGAEQVMEVRMGEGACLTWLPHPCVPHARADYRGTNRIFMKAGCRLVWGEVLTCGRRLNGEEFLYSSYHVRTEVFIGEELALLENVFLQPALMPVQALGQMEGFTHQASLLCIGGDVLERKGEIEPVLSGLEGMRYGVSEGPAGSLVVRMLGSKAEPLYEALQAIAQRMTTGPINTTYAR